MKETKPIERETTTVHSTYGVSFAAEKSLAACLNCGFSLKEPSNYCPQCGQTTHVHRLNVAHLLHEVVHFFTHADKGIFYLLRMLATRPGTVVRGYITGRRKAYFSPLNFFLIAVGMFLFVQTTIRPMGIVNMDASKKEVMQIGDPVVRERRLVKLERMETASNFMAKYSNYINMAVTPVIALLFFLFYRRAGYNYTEHLVANLYIAGFTALFYIFIITPYLLLTRGKPVYYIGIFLFLLWEALYRGVAYYGFIHKKGKRPLAYALFVSFFAVALWYFFSTGLFKAYVENGLD